MSLRNVLTPGYKVIEWMEPSMLGSSWGEALQEEFEKPYFVNMNKKLAFDRALKDSAQIYPPHEDVFAWSHYCNIEDVKVVIIGQDPSYIDGVACGLSFSSIYPDAPCKSLKIIFEEMERDIRFIPPPHGDLTKWAKQGVLHLNSILTVTVTESGKPKLHKDIGWEQFTDAVIECINQRCQGVVFMLWGKFAEAKKNVIDNSRHYVLEACHPAYQPQWNVHPFMGCENFSEANHFLQSQGKYIDWSLQ